MVGQTARAEVVQDEKFRIGKARQNTALRNVSSIEGCSEVLKKIAGTLKDYRPTRFDEAPDNGASDKCFPGSCRTHEEEARARVVTFADGGVNCFQPFHNDAFGRVGNSD